jgi:sialic acid synthase SpsE
VPSGEITNAPYLYKIASYGIKVILSTGMATLEEIHHALAFLAYGFANKKDITFSNVINFYQTNEAKSLLQNQVTILHCTSEYPAPFEELNLNALDHLKEVFTLEVGYSDHSEGILAPIAAVAKGAKIIEKHFTLDKELPGPDHKASLNPLELKEMIQSIRTIELALGNGNKAPTTTETKNKDIVRKSLVVAKPIKTGESFSFENLTIKRPGTGIEPYYYWDYIGKIAERDYKQDEVIQ